MRSPFDAPEPAWQRWARRGSVLVAALASLAGHAALALWVFTGELPAKHVATWVDMELVEQEPPPPPPEPEPEPEPEPDKPKPKPTPEPVKFEETVEQAPEPPPEQTQRRVVRVQGLSATSFAEGSGTGLSVRAGNTTGVKAGPETMDIGDATDFTPLAYAAVTTKPRMRSVPPIQVPQAAMEAEAQGTWTVILDIDASGRVTNARMAEPAGMGIDEACLEAWRQSRWKPGQQDGQPVPITGIPMKCTIKLLD